MPHQKIKIEIASIPSETKVFRNLAVNYPSLDPSLGLLVPCQTSGEILADKLVALPGCTSYIRHRDVWDIFFLRQRGVVYDVEHVSKKIKIYGIEDYSGLLEQRIQSINDPSYMRAFVQEMERFIPQRVQDATLKNSAFFAAMINNVSEALSGLKLRLSDKNTPSFFDEF